MKKFLMFFVLAIVAVMNSQAQEIQFGIKGGVNFASIRGDYLQDISGVTGFHVGGVVEIPVLGRLSLQPEILYATQGAQRDQTYVDGNMVETRLDYLNIPIMGKFYINEELSVTAGPKMGILLSAENEITGSGFIGGPVQPYKKDVKEFFNTLDLGITVGVEYKLPIGVFVQLRYIAGLLNINKESTDMVLGNFYLKDTKNYNNVFQISAGYSF